MKYFKRGDIIKDKVGEEFLVVKIKCKPENKELCDVCKKRHLIPCNTKWKRLPLVIEINSKYPYGLYFRGHGDDEAFNAKFARKALPDELLKITVKIKEEAVREEVKKILKERL